MTRETFRGTYHDVHLADHPARQTVWGAVAAHLARWIPPNGAVVEIGAGHCHWINQVRAARRVAVDLWSELPRYAARGVDARVLDASVSLPSLGTALFDAALASNVLEHFDADAAARLADDVRDLLCPGGRFIVIQPNFRYAYRRYFDDFTHRAVFTDVSLPTMLRSRGFAIEHVEPRFLPYSMRQLPLPVPGWLVRAYLRAPFRPGAGQMLVIASRP